MKNQKTSKKFLAFALVLFLCIENFAAIVSDNDGSAFITKAEFDSLKNNFQSQIDQYNTSIDNKIDGAIAAYLAGIKVETETTKSIFTKNWENVTLINGVKAQTYAYPNISASIGIFNNRYNTISYDDPLRDWYIATNWLKCYILIFIIIIQMQVKLVREEILLKMS